MRILDRYLATRHFRALCFCLAFFSVLFVVIDTFNNLDEYLKNQVTPWIVLSYYAYLLPSIFVQLAPAAALVSLLYVLSDLEKHNELLAIRSGGVSALGALIPYLFIGTLLSVATLVVNETAVPKSYVKSTAIKEGLIEKGRRKFEEQAIRNVALKGRIDRMIFAREFEVMTQTLHEVIILEGGPDQPVKAKLTAKKAVYRNGRWTFYDVTRHRLNRRGDMVGEPMFTDEMELDMPETPDDFIRDPAQVEFMNSPQLRAYIGGMTHSSEKVLRRLWVDFHYKTALPFISLSVMLIGAALAMRNQRGGVLVGIGTSLLILLAFYGSLSVCLALGKGGFLPPFLAAWMCNFGFAGTGAYLLKRSP